MVPSLTAVLLLAGPAFAEEVIVTVGLVTRVEPDAVAFRDAAGKETRVKGSAPTLKKGDRVLVVKELPPVPRTEVTAGDIAFLTKDCQIAQTDVDVIPRLKEEVRARILARVDAKDLDGLKAFKATRDYLRLFSPPPSTSPPTPKGYDPGYFTAEEWGRVNAALTDILRKSVEQLRR